MFFNSNHLKVCGIRSPLSITLLLVSLSQAGWATPARSGSGASPAASVHRSKVKKTSGSSKDALGNFASRVEKALDEGNAQKAFWGIVVRDENSGEILYSLNPEHLFTPASNTKLFTSALALASLSPDYHFRTTIETTGSLNADGTLHGDLAFVGRGDPDLSNRKYPYAGKVEESGPPEAVLAEMADVVVAHGVKEITGDIVGDESYFSYDPYPAGWSFGDLYFAFGAPVSAVALNDNFISLQIAPGASVGAPAVVVATPWPGYESFAHEIVTAPAGSKTQLAVVTGPGEKRTLVRGSIAVGAQPAILQLAMDDPASYAANVLKLLLESHGVRVMGQARAKHGTPPDRGVVLDPTLEAAMNSGQSATSQAGDPPGSPTVLAEHFSPPLVELIRMMNKVSLNLHAELLLRTVAKEKTGVGTTDNGLQIEQAFLKSVGIPDGEAILEDGSGLSTGNLVTPLAVTQLLEYAAHQPWGNAFRSTLPVAGQDGTLDHRMLNTPAAGRIWAKTGTLERVRGLSGYADTVQGAHLAFAIFANNDPDNGQDATRAFDEICEAMVEEIRPAAKSPHKK